MVGLPADSDLSPAIVLAHLKRDLWQIVEQAGPGAWVGRKGLRYHRLVFALWHRFREGRFDQMELGRRMLSLQRRFGRLLRKGLACAEEKTARFCANLLRFEEALWTFVRKEGVEPCPLNQVCSSRVNVITSGF